MTARSWVWTAQNGVIIRNKREFPVLRRILATMFLAAVLAAVPSLAAEEITLVVWDWQGFRNE